MSPAPYLRQPASIHAVMRTVLLALLPAVAVYVYLFGGGILVQLLIASTTACAIEAAILALRRQAVRRALADLSAVVCAWLIVLCLPPIVPWWITVTAVAVAIGLAKHVYGGLGQNPFNPAMAAYCTMIVAFPALMSQWPPLGQSFDTQLALIFGSTRELDAVTGATALDTLRTGLRHGEAIGDILTQPAVFGLLGGRGWEWLGLAYLLGGLLLLVRGIISWRIPVAFLATIFVLASAFWLGNPDNYAPPWVHLVSGGTLLAAFFILTDPVTSCSTPRGKIVFAVGVGVLAYLIRVYGNFPDGIAFAVLLMNICVPLIDRVTQPTVFGR